MASYVYDCYLVRKRARTKVDMAAKLEEEIRDEGIMGCQGKREKKVRSWLAFGASLRMAEREEREESA